MTKIKEKIEEIFGLKLTIEHEKNNEKIEIDPVLKSAIAGEVSFAQIWVANQTVNAADNVFAVVPNSQTNYVGKVVAPAQNSGKIKLGQQVNIRLANFPDREFGVLRGTVKNISLVPDKDGNLLLDISLPNGLKTNYKKAIPFQQEMQGTADIITEDLQLIERILYQFKESDARTGLEQLVRYTTERKK